MAKKKNKLKEQQKKKNYIDEYVSIKTLKKEETRSKRVNLILKPSIYEKAQLKCGEMGISFNEAVNQFVEHWIVD